MLAGLAFAVAALLASRARPARVVAGLLAIALVISVVGRNSIPDVKLDGGKVVPALSKLKTIYSSWSPLFRVDVRPFGNRLLLFHDGLLGSEMDHWDGNPATLGQFGFQHDVRDLPFTVEPQPAHEAIIGAAAGNEVVASLYFGAHKIDAVELNPVTYHLVVHTMANYDGHLAQNPKVHYVNADGRSYLARTNTKYDLVWFPAPDSYSATNASTASALVLSESYLYTRQAVTEAMKRLTPNGAVVAQFGEQDFADIPNRTARYVATARAALEDMGIHDLRDHVMVARAPAQGGLPGVSTIIVKPTRFTAAEVARFVAQIGTVAGAKLVYAPGVHAPTNLVTQTIVLSDSQLNAVHSHYPYSVGPVTDDKPFFWHFTPIKRVLREYSQPITGTNVEVAVGERVLLLLLGVAVVLAALFLLLPFFAIRRTWARLPGKGRSALYFAGIGFGFIFFEIALIQRLVLFLGYPTYSLTVTLSSLLISVGVGALLSSRLDPARALPYLAIPIVALTAYYVFGLGPTTSALMQWPLDARIAAAFVLLAPLGLCLGMFMPIGVRVVAASCEHSQEYVAWAWAVNGFASVIGSALATILAMTFGFTTVMELSLVGYGIALASHWATVRSGAAGVSGAAGEPEEVGAPKAGALTAQP
jgi:hypothetical protein